MKIAYADPPYPHQAARHYSHDERCAEVPHHELIEDLRRYDGWALSTSSTALRWVWSMCPEARPAAWVKPFASFKPNVNPAYAWEPVLFVPARSGSREKDTVRDWHAASITLKKGLAGAKPPSFCFWLFDLLGAEPEDEFDDVFPGTGIVMDCWNQFCGRPVQFELIGEEQ